MHPTRRLILMLLASIPLIAEAADLPVANVVFYDGDPSTTSRPRAVAAQLVPGYTTASGPYDGTAVTVQRLNPSFANGFQGMSALEVLQTLPPPAGQYHVAVNQIHPGKAVAWFGALSDTTDPYRAEIDPPPGKYEVTQAISFYKEPAAASIKYRINNGPQQTWDGAPFHLASSATITYKGTHNGQDGPEKIAAYTIDFPDCADTDRDGLPDRIELIVGTNPLVAESDINKNRRGDFDEVVRGALTIAPNTQAPDFADSDGDGWSNYDETLRETPTNNAAIKPVAPNLRTVEIVVSGTVENTSPGGTPPPANPVPGKPYPNAFRFRVLNPSGEAQTPAIEGGNNTFTLRTSGESFHYLAAAATDGSGRVLVSVQAPRALCIDPASFCGQASDLAQWRNAYRAAYAAQIFLKREQQRIDPRSTALALLVNRYYELNSGPDARFAPGQIGSGPEPDLVYTLRARRNEEALLAQLDAAVTPAMIDLVADYYRFHTAPRSRSMMALLADHFAGRSVAIADVPAGVRIANIATAAEQTAAAINSIPSNETVLTGPVASTPSGWALVSNGTTYRLEKLPEAFPVGTQLSIRAIVDVDNCNYSQKTALVTGILSRTSPPPPPMVDTDGDGLSDDWELINFGDLDETADGDPDNDGATNEEEQGLSTNPLVDDAGFLQSTGWMLQ